MKAKSVRPLLLVLLFGFLATQGWRITEYAPEVMPADLRAVRSDHGDAQRLQSAPLDPASHHGSRVSPRTATPRSARAAAQPLAARGRASVVGPSDPGPPRRNAAPALSGPLANRFGVLDPAQLNGGPAVGNGTAAAANERGGWAPGFPAQNFPGAAYDAPAADLPEPGALGLFGAGLAGVLIAYRRSPRRHRSRPSGSCGGASR